MTPASSSYRATFAPAETFGALTLAEARRRGADHIRQLVVLGDGAVWIWNQATARFPEATQIMDLYHAREHLHALADLARPATGEHHPDWLADRLAELDAGDIHALTTAARNLPLTGTAATDRDKALGYLETNTHRMRYAHYRKLGMFVGSGSAPSKPAARPSPANASNSPACAGPPPAPPPSSPCAPNTPAAAGTRSGPTPTTRHQQPEPTLE